MVHVWSAWLAQSVKCLSLISAQVMISQFMGLSPTLIGVLSVSLSVSLPLPHPPHSHALSLLK